MNAEDVLKKQRLSALVRVLSNCKHAELDADEYG